MLTRAIAVAIASLALIAPPDTAAQDSTLYVRDAGPGRPGEILRRVLGARHIRRWEKYNTRLFRDSVFDTSVVVLASDATVASTVHGDVVVIDGDLYLEPGASIDGNAVAIGGGVYDSQQSHVGGEKLSFRDVRYDTVRTSRGLALDYHITRAENEEAGLIELPLLYGLRVPAYDRVNGLSLPWGPRVTLAHGVVVIDPTVTWRTDLGAFDPGATVRVNDGRPGPFLRGFAGRTTASNDRWIQSDLANSATVILIGRDYRNYWRADRFEGRAGYGWERSTSTVSLWGGARTERDWSVSAGGPWSFTGKNSDEGLRRPNPAIDRGRVSSALAGLGVTWDLPRLQAGITAEAERAFDAPGGARFTQTTADVHVAFPTFVTHEGTQSFELLSHLLWTAGDTAPPQRFAYMGGNGSLPTFDFGDFGGDELVFVESRYNVPLQTLQIPLLGAPVLTLRHMLGAAGVQRLPKFESNLGLRITLNFLRVDYFVNPANGDQTVGAGLSIVR